jgi:NACalpha-BTF3-like transcription factor
MSDPAAAAGAGDDLPDVDESTKNLSKEQAAESKQLDTVTDFVEDREMDTSKATAALSNLTGAEQSDAEARAAKELAAVKVNDEDIELLARELEINQEDAEQRIRKAKGDINVAIQQALQ